MNAKNYNYVVLIIIGLVIALISFLVSKFKYSPNTEFWTNIGLAISEFSGFIMLIRNGTFIRTKYFRVFKGVFAIILIGALFKILHYPYGNEIIVVGFAFAVLIYFFSFLNKPIRKRLDYLKLFWVVVAYTGGILRFLHIINDDYQILSSAIMWLAIIDYMKMERQKRRLFD
ncbi:GldL-related protein [Snuella lapsa]|uniref:Gliding motility protein GldL-like N-terminal domain-containing protein n=1 Tax=Snuella lapsa TaxID=870481 RepID=A0ABP6X5X9_9FLAO